MDVSTEGRWRWHGEGEVGKNDEESTHNSHEKVTGVAAMLGEAFSCVEGDGGCHRTDNGRAPASATEIGARGEDEAVA